MAKNVGKISKTGKSAIQTKPRQRVSQKSAMAVLLGKISKTGKSAIQTKPRQHPALSELSGA